MIEINKNYILLIFFYLLKELIQYGIIVKLFKIFDGVILQFLLLFLFIMNYDVEFLFIDYINKCMKLSILLYILI